MPTAPKSEMCGNGVRCVAKYVYDHGIARQATADDRDGPRRAHARPRGRRAARSERVRVDMGEPILRPPEIPTKLPGDPPVDVADRGRRPATLAGDRRLDGQPARGDLRRRRRRRSRSNGSGPLLEHHPAFPRRVNVHFVEVIARGEVRCGPGSAAPASRWPAAPGACAVCVAGVLTGRTGRKLLAHLPGGDLELEWADDDASVFMTGPATEVFSGEWLTAPRSSPSAPT